MALWPVRPFRAAATRAAQAAEPQARVKPTPRSQTFKAMCAWEVTWASEIFARSGKIGWFSSKGPIFERSKASISSTQNIACGLPILTAEGVCKTGASIGPICNSDLSRVMEWQPRGAGFHPKQGAGGPYRR